MATLDGGRRASCCPTSYADTSLPGTLRQLARQLLQQYPYVYLHTRRLNEVDKELHGFRCELTPCKCQQLYAQENNTHATCYAK